MFNEKQFHLIGLKYLLQSCYDWVTFWQVNIFSFHCVAADWIIPLEDVYVPCSTVGEKKRKKKKKEALPCGPNTLMAPNTSETCDKTFSNCLRYSNVIQLTGAKRTLFSFQIQYQLIVLLKKSHTEIICVFPLFEGSSPWSVITVNTQEGWGVWLPTDFSKPI